MSFQVNLAPSVVAKLAKTATDGEEEGKEGSGNRREDWRKLKELEEARKAGTAPAMQDEEGRDINPHIPQYIMQAPWYYDVTQATLKHQRMQEEAQKTYSGLEEWYKKGVKKGQVATKYRKGACANCGALTHVKKDCLERPRKVGAKFTGDEIAPDEHLQPQLDFDYDGKRDRWNGYDPSMHKKIYEDFQMLEEAKRQLKAKKLEDPSLEEEEREKLERDEDLDDEDDEDKYADDMDMPGQKFESKQRITVRNLRIREDTAKYLYNLNVNSAFYDPKTRSMRENPFNGKHPTEIPFAGDNFVRYSGDAHQMTKQQIFAWEAYEKGTEAHLQADPTKLEILANEYSRKKEDYKTNVKDSILDKYGGQEHLEAPPKELLLAQTEDYVEYSRQGTIIKGAEKAKIKSRYEEDVYINNHTNVWGSWWKEGHWGFACCHSTIKMSYCTGSAGQSAEDSSIIALAPAEHTAPPEEEKSPHKEEQEEQEKVSRKKKKKKEKKRKRKHKKKRRKEVSSSSDDSDGTDEDEVRERKIKEAMEKEEERRKEVDRIMKMDERKRPYNVCYDFKAPTEEDLEAYKRTKYNPEDPMANFLTK